MRQILFGIFLIFTVLGKGTAYAQQPPAQRIISLGPVLTEELYLLGVEDKLVGCTTYCQRPEAAKLKAKVGNIQEINLEKVVALKPDLVLSTVLTDPRAKEKMRQLGIRVVDIPNARNFDEVCEVFLKLGDLAGKAGEAQAIVARARKDVAALTALWQGKPRLKVFVQVGVEPLVTIGRNAFVDDLITLAGGDNIVREPEYLQYSREKVMVSDPDIIFISSMGFSGEVEKKNWEKFTALKAVRTRQLFVLDEYLLCSPTPVTFVSTLKAMIRHIHPEVGL